MSMPLQRTPRSTGRSVAIKIMENIADNMEEIDEEFLVYRDLCLHPNIPSFYGLYFNAGKKREDDQLWFVMEVSKGKVSISVHVPTTCPVLVRRPTAMHRRLRDRPGAVAEERESLST